MAHLSQTSSHHIDAISVSLSGVAGGVDGFSLSGIFRTCTWIALIAFGTSPLCMHVSHIVRLGSKK